MLIFFYQKKLHFVQKSSFIQLFSAHVKLYLMVFFYRQMRFALAQMRAKMIMMMILKLTKDKKIIIIQSPKFCVHVHFFTKYLGL